MWIDACKEGDLSDGEHLTLNCTNIRVSLFFVNGTYYAIEDTCTHDGAEIATGKVVGSEITCPRHGARFCIKTGKSITPPAYEDILSFPTRINEYSVQILIPE